MLDIESLVSDDGSLISRKLFYDEEIYRLEQERIFARCWLFLGHESQFAKPGDFFSTSLGEAPVIVARGRDGAVHASLNTCRHRGLRVCRADEGNARSFVCPYHGWTYGVDGRLLGMPDKDAYDGLDFARWGLIPVPRVESYKGLLFGNLDPSAMSLVEYLGDMAFFLDAHLDRREGGTEVLGGVHRWRMKTNWKMPAENQMGDYYHGEWTHQSILRLQAASGMSAAPDGTPLGGPADIRQNGVNVACGNGHGVISRFYAADAPIEQRMPGEGQAQVADYFRSVQPEADARLGPVKSRVKSATLTVFPTLSLVGSVCSIRVAHPRGPGACEIHSYAIVDRDAPDEVKDFLRRSYQIAFGPAGAFEADDGENWEQVTEGARIDAGGDHPFHFGLALGREYQHPELPGLCGSVISEHNQRAMYRYWRDLMVKP